MAIRKSRSGGTGRSVRPGASGRSPRTSGATSGSASRTSSARKRFSDRLQRQRAVWLGVNVLLALALLGGTAAAGLFGWQAWQDYRTREGHKEAQAAARQVVVDFLTISASSVSKDIDSVLDGSTGEFHEQYQDGAAQVRTAVVENKVDSTGKVLRSGVVSGDIDSAVVIIAVDATIKNVRSPEGRKAHYRVQVDMVYEKNRWLVSRLEFVG